MSEARPQGVVPQCDVAQAGTLRRWWRRVDTRIYLVYAHLLPSPVIKAVVDFTKQSSFLPVHRLRHRRLHPRHEPGRADQGIPEDPRAARGRLTCGRRGRHPGRLGEQPSGAPITAATIGAAGVTAITLYLQIATRIGGAVTITLALLVLARLG